MTFLYIESTIICPYQKLLLEFCLCQNYEKTVIHRYFPTLNFAVRILQIYLRIFFQILQIYIHNNIGEFTIEIFKK